MIWKFKIGNVSYEIDECYCTIAGVLHCEITKNAVWGLDNESKRLKQWLSEVKTCFAFVKNVWQLQSCFILKLTNVLAESALCNI